MNIILPNAAQIARMNLSEKLQDIVEGGGYGRVVDLGQIISLIQDDEPIVGLEATEFTREGLLHPERYQPIVNLVGTLARHSGLTAPRILDFGCGPAILTSMIARELPQAQVTGIDLSQDMLDIAKVTTAQFQVIDRVYLHQYDARLVAGQAATLADIAVSRNMLHRVDGLTEALYRMVSAVRSEGGMVAITAFRQVSDLDDLGQAAFVKAVQERKSEENLVRAFVRAHLSAPSLEQYRQAALTVARQLDVTTMRVWAGNNNNVGIYFRR